MSPLKYTIYVYDTGWDFPDNFLTFVMIDKLIAHQYGSAPKISHWFPVLRQKENVFCRRKRFPLSVFQGWAQGSFVKAEVKADRSRKRRGEAAMFLTEARQRQRQRVRGRGEAD